jgi:MarR family transcriptional regulator for hemolysin
MSPSTSNPQVAARRGDALPIGRQVALTAKALGRAFNAALVAHGGSLPTWLVLSALEQDQWRTQLELARALGIEGPTLTRHLDALEQAGLVARRRDEADRRIVRVEATEAGRLLHRRLLEAAIAFDKRLRAGFDATEIEQLGGLLARLQANLGPDGAVAPRQM